MFLSCMNIVSNENNWIIYIYISIVLFKFSRKLTGIMWFKRGDLNTIYILREDLKVFEGFTFRI